MPKSQYRFDFLRNCCIFLKNDGGLFLCFWRCRNYNDFLLQFTSQNYTVTPKLIWVTLAGAFWTFWGGLFVASFFWQVSKSWRFSLGVCQSAPKLVLVTLAGAFGGALFVVLCNPRFAFSAGIYNDLLLCNGLRKELIRIISEHLYRFIPLQRFAETANSHYQRDL